MKRSSLLFLLLLSPLLWPAAESVSFPSGDLTLHGVLYKPEGTGPFPAVLYNHGSAPGMLSSQAFEVLGPVFASRGWVFFGPYRRGQGLSASAGPFIGDQIAAAQKDGGVRAGAAAMVRLLETDHLDDQLAALAWLRTQGFVRPDRIAAAGNSFGGRTLSAAMKDAGKVFEMKIYPAYGKSVEDGHSFGYFGSAVWADDVFRCLEQHCRGRQRN